MTFEIHVGSIRSLPERGGKETESGLERGVGEQNQLVNMQEQENSNARRRYTSIVKSSVRLSSIS